MTIFLGVSVRTGAAGASTFQTPVPSITTAVGVRLEPYKTPDSRRGPNESREHGIRRAASRTRPWPHMGVEMGEHCWWPVFTGFRPSSVS